MTYATIVKTEVNKMEVEEIKELVVIQIELLMHKHKFEELDEINEKISNIKDGSPVLKDYIDELLSNNEITEDDSHLMRSLATEYFLRELYSLHEEITKKIKKYGKENHDLFQSDQKEKVKTVMSLIFDN